MEPNQYGREEVAVGDRAESVVQRELGECCVQVNLVISYTQKVFL